MSNLSLSPVSGAAAASPQRLGRSAPSVSAVPSVASSSSATVQQRVQRSQQQSAQVAQPGSPQMLQQGVQQIQGASSQALAAQLAQDSPLLQATQLGQQLIARGAQVHDLATAASEWEVKGVKPLEQMGALAEAVGENISLGERTLPSAEGVLFQAVSGVAPETLSHAKGYVDTGLQVVQACKTAHSLQQAYLSYGTAEFGAQASTAATQTYVMLGGQSSLALGEKVSAFCQNVSYDGAKEVVAAAAEFSGDDSLVAGLQRSALSTASSYCLGSTATSYVAQAVPVLSFGVAAMDAANAAQASYNWSQGTGSGKDALKSVITAIGSGTGATVAPVIGPLAASALNLGIDGASAAYDYVSSWWS